ncbi:MAG TPA: type I glutamate--ammonia ligase [Firmicutes bacterium]|nr:type I glutamate--ammonia ligase [Candidatus Fermentithermobacillaceae bacterium]
MPQVKKPATKDDVLRLAEEQRVKFVLLQFTDILGVMKNVSIPVEQLPKALDGQILFDGSSVHGFVRIEESDMLLKPDPATFVCLPWLSDREMTARLICDIYTPDGEPFAGCPRLTLKKVLREAASMGYTVNMGPEAEFFLFELDEDGRPTVKTKDTGGYFDHFPVDTGEDARRDMVIALQDLGYEIEASHHETAPAQHEIDFRYADALLTADRMITLKLVVHTVARKHRLHATFMPKPVYGVAGSGMHVHQSLFRGDSNAFDDPNGPYGLSSVCLNYLGGLLAHARGMTAITNPLVNSYKRLVSGYEAPVYIAWSEKNRSPLVRVPARRGLGTRLELRSPDPSCNPYLAFAAMIAAGLDGVKKGIEPPPPVQANIYCLNGLDREKLGIASLPASLEEAVEEMLRDEVIVSAIGEHIISRFVDAKRIEWDTYRMQIHEWELDKYLSVF